MGLIDEIVKAAKEINPEFDKDSPKDMDIAAKTLVLSMKKEKCGKEIRESYLKEVVEEYERRIVEKALKEAPAFITRSEMILSRLDMLELEKDIIERKIKVLKEFMD